jgi:molecular chaperone GrpE
MSQPDTQETPSTPQADEARHEGLPTPEDALIAAKKEAAENYDRYLRLGADLENFRRRSIREKDEARTSAAARVVEDMLPVYDNLVLALVAAKQPNADLKTLLGGMDMVLQQLKTALSSHGIKEINPKGEAFDPHQHEAISHQASSDVKPEHVISVVRTGFSHNGRLLRPASVIVSSGAQPPSA